MCNNINENFCWVLGPKKLPDFAPLKTCLFNWAETFWLSLKCVLLRLFFYKLRLIRQLIKYETVVIFNILFYLIVFVTSLESVNFMLRANKYFTLTVVHVMCQSREGGEEGGMQLIEKGILVGKLESNRSGYQSGRGSESNLLYSCVLVLWPLTRLFYKNQKPDWWKYGKTSNKTTSCNLFAKFL